MRVVRDSDGVRETVHLRTWQPDAPLLDVLGKKAAQQEPRYMEPDEISVDGVPMAPTTRLEDAGLWEGSLVCAGPAPRPVLWPSATEPSTAPGWHIAVTGGLETGPAIPLPPRATLTVGRSPQADISVQSEAVSWVHCAFTQEGAGVRIRDTGSTNGTFVDGTPVDPHGIVVAGESSVCVGDVVVTISVLPREVPAIDAGVAQGLGSMPGPDGTVLLNRPPLPTPGPDRAADPPLITVPQPQPVPDAAPLNLLTILAPLGAAVLMVLVVGDFRFLLLSMLSPVLALGTFVEQRRRRRKQLRDEDDRFDREIAAFAAAIGSARAAERHRRRSAAPGPAIVLRQALLSSANLWQRRAGNDGFLEVRLGTGDVTWTPRLGGVADRGLHERVQRVLDASVMTEAPIIADLTDRGVLGVVGDPNGVRAFARSLVVQAAAHCGPADLAIGVWCEPGREREWEWAGWLPHTLNTAEGDGQRWLAHEPNACARMLRSIRDDPSAIGTPALLAVIDSRALTHGSDAPARDLLAGGRPVGLESGFERGVRGSGADRALLVSGIVLAQTTQDLPAVCTEVVEVGPDGSGVMRASAGERHQTEMTVSGVSVDMATLCGRHLARFEDPERTLPHGRVPSQVGLASLLTAEPLTVTRVQELWSHSSGLSTPVGLTAGGVSSIDLVRDGPHGLVGGTTGSGKSEFLRSLIVGLAVNTGPAHLNFVLIDFKGGSAFGPCDRLPHTIGTVSNLDAALAFRAVRALEAELGRRQRLFAAAGDDVDSLNAYLATNPVEPLPRLVLVVDEFAMLAKEFPEVLAALVNIATIGRTLGVHMVLATQRPAGVVTEDILANTNLRVALRVQSKDDSRSVLGTTEAAGISRQHPGRSYIRRGEGDVTAVQTALVTAPSGGSRAPRLEVAATGPFGVPLLTSVGDSGDGRPDAPTELDDIIDVLVAAHEGAGAAAPRPVWPEPLGPRVELGWLERMSLATGVSAEGELVSRQRLVPVGLADQPEHQRQIVTGWDRNAGNLLLVGIAGSGISTALASLALVLTEGAPPDALDLLCLDCGSQDLSEIAGLPHTLSYAGAGADARERQLRFIRYIATEVQRRREVPGAHRAAVVLIDGFATLRDSLQDPAGQDLFADLVRAYIEGPAVGVHFAVATTRARAVPAAMEETTPQRWVFRLPDPVAYAALGLRGGDVPAAVPGRCVDVSSKHHMQIAIPADGLGSAVERSTVSWSGFSAKTEIAAALPKRVASIVFDGLLEVGEDASRVPVGIREDTLGTAYLELYDGEHALIAGPARSGKSSLLRAIADMILRERSQGRRGLPGRPGDALQVWGVAHHRSPLTAARLDRVAIGPSDIDALLHAAERREGTLFLLVDDVERLADSAPAFERLVAAHAPGLHMIVAGQSSELRSRYGHWTTAIRASRCGVLLQPDIDYDGELLGVRIPRYSPVPLSVGRGYSCSGGRAHLLQTVAQDPGRGDASAEPPPGESEAASAASATPAASAAPTERGVRPGDGARAARRRERAYARSV